MLYYIYFLIFKIFYLYIFRERGREDGRETSMCGCLFCAPLLGTWPTIQACALTGNWTTDPLVHRPALSPLSHTCQGRSTFWWCSQSLDQCLSPRGNWHPCRWGIQESPVPFGNVLDFSPRASDSGPTQASPSTVLELRGDRQAEPHRSPVLLRR